MPVSPRAAVAAILAAWAVAIAAVGIGMLMSKPPDLERFEPLPAPVNWILHNLPWIHGLAWLALGAALLVLAVAVMRGVTRVLNRTRESAAIFEASTGTLRNVGLGVLWMVAWTAAPFWSSEIPLSLPAIFGLPAVWALLWLSSRFISRALERERPTP